MADAALAPSQLFKSERPVSIPNLVRKPADLFFSIPGKKYADTVDKAIDKSSVNASTKAYLHALVEGDNKATESAYRTHKAKIDTNMVKSYFGEVLGPIHLLQHVGGDTVVFPVRSNYELFDYFLGNQKNFVGYSAKVAGGTSNTLAPGLINERISKLRKSGAFTGKTKIAADIMEILATKDIVGGLALSVGMLLASGMLPTGMTTAQVNDLKKINFTRDASILAGNKSGNMSKISLSSPASYKHLMDTYVLPRLKIPDSDKKKYLTHKMDYTATNIAYGMGMIIVDANKDGRFDVSDMVRKTFQDLNVLKIGLNPTTGVPTFELKNVSKAIDKYTFRSKYRWHVVKDKLGLQL